MPFAAARLLLIIGLTTASLVLVPAAQAQRAATGPPDWPCVQRLIPELSWGPMWTGPSPEELDQEWWEDEEIGSVVRFATARRTSEDEAVARVREFVEQVETDRERRLTLLFAGLFQETNSERGRTIEAVRRFARGQVARLEVISEKVDRLEQLREDNDADYADIQQAEDELFWERRVFEMRQQSLQAVCDQPYLLEERLSRMVRVIQAEL
ncbi:MAG: hypothetical protein LAT50_07445 [Ectothiorhodospiraceae bacterium]|nr:hypothetical protein [Ectothiorhodospiraceae bacterium]